MDNVCGCGAARGQLFVWARRYIHHTTSGVTVTWEDVNLRVWSRKASWGKVVLVVTQVENQLHLKTRVQCLARTRVVTVGYSAGT